MAETAKPATVGKSPYEEVVVHPLVLLSVVDHFRRVEEVLCTALAEDVVPVLCLEPGERLEHLDLLLDEEIAEPCEHAIVRS